MSITKCLLFVSMIALIACGDDEDPTPGATVDTVTPTDPATAGETTNSDPADDSEPSATIRLGHLNAGAGSIDICAALEGGAFQRLTTGGIAPQAISDPTELAPGTYDVHVVDVGADCSEPLNGVEVSLVDGFEGTLAVVGDTALTASVLLVPESISGVDRGAEIVVANIASTFSSADIGPITGGNFVPLVMGLSFQQAEALSIAEGFGSIDLGFAPTGTMTPTVTIEDLEVAEGDQITIYIVRDGSPNGFRYYEVRDGQPVGRFQELVFIDTAGEGSRR